ncbi:amino acid ABC transporter permease [Roseomonas sp. CCTCC AB2023176]|uniref:amino acid ABC transporter permease n=1 Tax=Roseomonas sp. CCTCC AB2023176 TaxID=3342640 RepID=UPI0035E08E18
MGYTLVFRDVLAQLDALAWGAVGTVWMSAVAILVGAVIGTFGAVARGSPRGWVRAASATYVEAFRNTPFLVQLFLIFFGLPGLGVRLLATEAGLLALSLNLGAYATEIIRAGIEGTAPGQIEAGQALGLRRWQVMRHVVILPALARVWPALSSQFVLTMLASSILSTVSAEELTSVAALVDSRTYRSFEVYLVAAGFYLTLTLLFRGAFAGVGWLLFPSRR